LKTLLFVWVGLAACGASDTSKIEDSAQTDTSAIDLEIETPSDSTERDSVEPVELESGDSLDSQDSIAEVDGAEVSVPDELDAALYCEQSVEMFCNYYVRCGRMAVVDLAQCRVVFLETCNGRYEPLYADLAARDALYLSRAGLERCAARLSTVACEQQIFDLDGCPDVWVGGHVAGGRCGPGLESFVCSDDTVCVLGLDFCGTCKPLATGACDLEQRCRDTEVCRERVCVGRGEVGEGCSGAGVPCIIGASCVDEVCRGPDVVAVGESCGQIRRCPYRSQCVSGRCVRTELVGESCGGEVGCASGFCDGGTCAPLKEANEACLVGSACVSGRCDGGLCRSVTWSCLQAP